MYNNFSRLSNYTALLVDEGLLPLMLHLMDTHPNEDILRRTSETLANLSVNRKNRREIASSGIAARLNLLFENGSALTKAYTLLIMGNLLSSGLFYDKVANPTTVTNLLDNLLDPRFPKQFSAVAYVICQLSRNQFSCDVMIDCGVVPTVLGYLRSAPTDCLDYLWTVLMHISQFDDFFPRITGNARVLVSELYEECRFDSSSLHQQISVTKIAYHLSKHSTFHQFLDETTIDLFVKTLKLLFSSRRSTRDIQFSALISLTHFAHACSSSRSFILSADLIEMFYDVGTEDNLMNVKYVGLLAIISNEENCCYKLLELGVQKFLVSLQDSFQKMADGSDNGQERKKSRKLGRQLTSNSLNNSRPLSPSQQQPHNAGANTAPPAEEVDLVAEGELGKAHTAAILHNIALKRPILAPGVLTMMLALAKNCKALRVMHVMRAMANMSVHSKSKLAIAKESKKIFPMLTVIMRCGCEEAERVQYYCAVTLCNILALSLEKTLLQDLVKAGAIVDLIVVTLLRINAIMTKEILGKAFFNLLARPEIRESLILSVDMLSAILELSKIEYVDLLELCIRAVYNVTCELTGPSGIEYSQRLAQLKVPSMMIQRLIYSPDQGGSMATRPIRLLLGMSVANMSFNKTLVLELAKTEGKIADALYRVHVLGSEEATYCAIVTLFNLSFIPECKVLADSKAIQLIVEVLEDETSPPNVLCTKLCVSALCNFSKLLVFHEQLTNLTLKPLVHIISSPSLHISVKQDAVQTCYNLATLYPPARISLIQHDAVSALWKLMKISGVGGGSAGNKTTSEQQNNNNTGGADVGDNGSTDGSSDEEYLLILIGRVLKELCEDVSDILILRKLLSDGAMSIILKLSKIEIIDCKITMSFCLYFLTRGRETMKLLKRDAVDILFWLTMYDALGSSDLILRNVSRAMRSFSVAKDDAVMLLKQERFFSVLKTLTKSKNEDVLWQTAGMIFNIMQVESCLKKFLERGLVATIFELAASGYAHVKHVCSACLHMIPEHIPNMDDPLSLELVLCLLEAEGDKFSEISTKPSDVITFPLEGCNRDSVFSHSSTSFLASWTPFTCLVENSFTPALIHVGGDDNDRLHVSIETASLGSTEKHRKLKGKDYDDFHGAGSTQADFPTTSLNTTNNAADVNQNLSQQFLQANNTTGMRGSGDDPDFASLTIDHGVTSKDFDRRPPFAFASSSDLPVASSSFITDGGGVGKRGTLAGSITGLTTPDSRRDEKRILPIISSTQSLNTVDAIRKSSKTMTSASTPQLLPSSLSYKSYQPPKK